MKPAGVILAAGLSSRMGSPKALLPLGATTFLGSLIDAFTAVLPQTTVVLGSRAEEIQATIVPRPGLRIVVNPDYEQGMLTSLQTGLRTIPVGAPAVFTLVDHPGLRPASLTALVEAFEQQSPLVLIARYRGERGHPVLLDPAVAAEILALPPDASAKTVVRSHRPETVFVDLDDPAVTLDIDRPEDYERLSARLGSEQADRR
ncbi:MAG: NTP transferase domain-containing protein [Acidobacteria bacterium]|nr:NTP transferase domain-containing protein [Acidobacteriota bacterium]